MSRVVASGACAGVNDAKLPCSLGIAGKNDYLHRLSFAILSLDRNPAPKVVFNHHTGAFALHL